MNVVDIDREEARCAANAPEAVLGWQAVDEPGMVDLARQPWLTAAAKRADQGAELPPPGLMGGVAA
jgi:hypothetical protein